MKAAAIIVLVLCLFALCGIGYLYATTTVAAEAVECIATDAVSQADYYRLLKDGISSDTFDGTLFSQDLPETPEGLLYYTYTVKVSNRTFLPVEIAELQVTPMSEDLLQLNDPEEHTVPSGADIRLSATILTAKTAHNIRELTVTWYIWGIPFSVRLTSQS